jgi:hypothetical protein
VGNHTGDAVDAHDASAVSFDATGNTYVTGSQVQAALDNADAALIAGLLSSSAKRSLRLVAGLLLPPASPHASDYEFDGTTSTDDAEDHGWSRVGFGGSDSYRESSSFGVVKIFGTGATQMTGLVKSLPTDANLEIVAKLTAATRGNITNGFGEQLVLRDSASGKMWTAGRDGLPGYYDLRLGNTWNSPTSLAALGAQVYSDAASGGEFWIRVRKNGAWTNVDTEVSHDGITWHLVQLGTSVGAFVTPNQVGFGTSHNIASNVFQEVGCDFVRFTPF